MNNAACKQRYEKLASTRSVYLDRGRACADLTIPSLLPKDGHTRHSQFVTPYQSIGSRGVNNLASKLSLSLFPPNTPFFRLSVDDFELAELAQDPEARSKVEEKLNEIERAVTNEIETSAMRAPLVEALRQLIVTGNVLMYFPKEGGVRVYRLDKYVVQRDAKGNVLDIIIKELVSPEALPDDIKALIVDPVASVTPEEDVEVYTKFWREGTKFKTYQEIEGHIVPGSEASWPISKTPILALRWTWVDNEDYGRGYVEEYFGDLKAAEGLSKAILECAAISAKVNPMVKPGAATNVKHLNTAENLEWVVGDPEDIGFAKVEKYADMQVSQSVLGDIIQRLSQAFLMQSAVQRNAERVTAYEIREMISELEDSLGGVYALMSQEMQLPMVRRVMDRMQKQKKLPKLPDDVVTPEITTGIEALGRGHDMNKLEILIKSTVGVLGPDAMQYINVGDLIKRTGTALGIDMDGLVKTEEQIQQEQQAAQQAQQDAMMQQGLLDAGKSAVAPVINAAAKGTQ